MFLRVEFINEGPDVIDMLSESPGLGESYARLTRDEPFPLRNTFLRADVIVETREALERTDDGRETRKLAPTVIGGVVGGSATRGPIKINSFHIYQETSN